MGVVSDLRSVMKVERIFWLVNESDIATQRGNHAHKYSSQLFFCGLGAADLTLESLDGESELIRLTAKASAILVAPLVWVDIVMQPGTNLTVISDWNYDEKEYVRDKAVWRSPQVAETA